MLNVFLSKKLSVCSVFCEERCFCRVASFAIAYHHEKYVKSLQVIESKQVTNLLWDSHAPCSV